MTKPGRLLLAGTLAFILALPLYLPAAWVFNRLAGHIPHAIYWRGVSGTILTPRLHSVSIELPYGNRFVIDGIDVDIRLWTLLTGRIGAVVIIRIGDDRINATGSLGPGRWRVESLDGTLQVASITRRLPGSELALSSGQIELSGEHWSGTYNAFPDQGILQIRLMNLQSDLAGPESLGDYQLDVNADTQGLKGNVTTVNSDQLLNVSANGSVDPSARQVTIIGTAEASPAAPESVRGLLPFFGAVENNRASIRITAPY